MRQTLALACILAITLMVSLACGGDEKTKPELLVPADANFIAEIQLGRLLQDPDIDGLLEELTRGSGFAPDTGISLSLEELVDRILDEIGIDIQQFSSIVVFGDVTKFEDSFGAIVKGSFDEDRLIAGFESASNQSLTVTEYRGKTVYFSRDRDVAISVLDDKTLVLGNTRASVRSVIEVAVGEAERVTGRLIDAFDALDDPLLGAVLILPDDIVEALGFPGDLVPEDAPINARIFTDVELISLSFDKRADNLAFDARVEFASESSASDVADILEGGVKILGGLSSDELIKGLLKQVEISRVDTTITLHAEASVADIKHLIQQLERLDDLDLGSGLGGFPFSSSIPSVVEEVIPVPAVPPEPVPAPKPDQQPAPAIPTITLPTPRFEATPDPEATPFSPLPPLAPDFSLNLYQGADQFPGLIDPETGSLQLSDLIGRPVVLHFWASGCPPCRADMPKFQEFFEVYGRTIAVIGIDVGPMVGLGSSEDSIAFLEGSDFTYPVGLPLDPDVATRYGVIGLPTTVFIDPPGGEIGHFTGPLEDGFLARMARQMRLLVP